MSAKTIHQRRALATYQGVHLASVRGEDREFRRSEARRLPKPQAVRRRTVAEVIGAVHALVACGGWAALTVGIIFAGGLLFARSQGTLP